MAKSKKSKILAMALCASVMTGIYASPVMAAAIELESPSTVKVGAAEYEVVSGTLNLDGEDIAGALNGTNLTLGSVTANTISTTGAANLNGGLTVSGGPTVIDGGLTVSGGPTVIDGGRLHANKGLTVSSHGISIEEGGDLSLADGDVYVGGTLDVNGETTLEKTTVNGTLTAGDTTLANTTVGGTLEVTDKLTANNGLKVTGETTLAKTTVNGTLTAGATDVESLDVTNNATVGGTLTAGATTVDSLTVKGAATVDSLEFKEDIKSANGKVEITKDGNMTLAGHATISNGATIQKGLSVTGGASVDGNFAVTNGGLSVSGGESVLNGGLTVNNGDTKLNGKLDVGAGNFKVDTAGNTEFNGNLNIKHGAFEVTADDGSFSAARDKFNVFADGSFNAASENFKVSADGVINADSLYLQTYGGGTLEVGGALQALTDAKLPDKVGGIERVPEDAGVPGNGTTTIENGAEFTETAMTMGDTIVESGKITVGVADNQTIIEGGAITAKSLLLDGKDVGKTIFGIERDEETATTTIEGASSFDANGMSIKDAGFGTSLGVAGMEITAAGGLKTSFTAGEATFVGASGTTTINGGAIETTTINGVNFTQWHDEVDGRLEKLEYKTQNINGSEGTTAGGDSVIDVPATAPGHTGITGDVTVGGEINADEIVVGDKDSDNKTTINGGNITTGDTTIDGEGINTGNGDFSGEVNVGGNTNITGDGITTGNITADTGNIGDIGMAGDTITTGETTINGSGMTVGTGENATSITNDTVKAQNGDFDNLTAGSGTFGTGNNKTVINNDGVTVGGENGSSITGEGITVGDKNGVSIKNDEVRVGGGEDGKGGSYMNDTDVVTGEGVSLNQTAERVGHLENRVGKLEDRIDKVGAMAAAIANLRTMGYDPAAPTEVAVGIGQYRDETGAALGLFHYPNRDFMLSLSVSTSGDEVMGGIGATWKFGRKSPEKVAEIKKAQAEADARRAEEAKLAKAEEMKQAAKEAKIKAQQERHAKLAAERAAQAEAAK